MSRTHVRTVRAGSPTSSHPLGRRIREIRNAREMTQRELAAALGIDDFYVSRLETGHVNPTVKTLERLAKALGVAVRDFFPAGNAGVAEPPGEAELDQRKLVKLWQGLTADHRLWWLRLLRTATDHSKGAGG